MLPPRLICISFQLEGATAGAANHSRKAEEAVSRLWREFEAACLGCGTTTIEASQISADAAVNSGDNNGAENGGVFGDDGGGGVSHGGRAPAALGVRASSSADGGRGRRRRVGGGILSISKSKGSSVSGGGSGGGSGRDLAEEGWEAPREVFRGAENERKPWVD